MIAHEFEYVKPSTLAEALELLAGDDAKPLAGGMSLIPMMKLRLAMPGTLVDLSGLAELKTIEANGKLHIGAGVTHFEITTSAVVKEKSPLLWETATHVGDLQVRNTGTIGGSVAHNDPAADYPAALMALGAEVHLASRGGRRTLPISEFVVDALTTALEPGEIVTGIAVPLESAGVGTCYQKVRHPASGYAVVGIAVRASKTEASVGVTGLASKAFRALKCEAALKGGASAVDAAALVGEGVEASADLYASADYRKHLACVHAARAITTALARCQ